MFQAHCRNLVLRKSFSHRIPPNLVFGVRTERVDGVAQRNGICVCDDVRETRILTKPNQDEPPTAQFQSAQRIIFVTVERLVDKLFFFIFYFE